MNQTPEINLAIVRQLIQYAKDHYLPFDPEAHPFDLHVQKSKKWIEKDSLESPHDFLNLNREIKPFPKEKSFHELLYEFLDRHFPQKDEKVTEIYKKVNISRSHWSKMLSDPNYQPKVDTVFKLIFAFELSMKDAKRFLASAGYAFNRSKAFDLVLLGALDQKIYLLGEIDRALFEHAKKTLFSLK